MLEHFAALHILSNTFNTLVQHFSYFQCIHDISLSGMHDLRLQGSKLDCASP